ncbi:hypothetical protein DUNSADRAFT_7836 [Dunaliella salina]|uniref:Uncharacterized protein n=1 Tax=Dunaliella salina TaxID=3046 RepID=A0ABQ7GKL1_DUNSA|nr:hypothetical protein DUNSADRAFT_7836 [Dunaliella salina]|eukprot:KAF5835161.1 hypothetical protein DUNSADRAFT_7836 [Dunaliella salina]
MLQDVIRAATELKVGSRGGAGRHPPHSHPAVHRHAVVTRHHINGGHASFGWFTLGHTAHRSTQASQHWWSCILALVQEDHLHTAIQRYTRALSIFLWFDRGQDNAAEDIALLDSITLLTNEQQAEQAKQLCAVLFNNIATCLLRTERTHDAIFAASKALELVPYNARALYRRAVCSHNLGTSAGLEAAVQDLQAALSLEPGNAQVRACLVAFKEELLEHKRRERAMYSKMLHNEGGLFPDEGEQGGEIHPEIKRKKHMPDIEVHSVVRNMQKNMQRVQASEASERYSTPQQTKLFNFLRLPWWAWLIVVAHLLYRITKIFGSKKREMIGHGEASSHLEL